MPNFDPNNNRLMWLLECTLVCLAVSLLSVCIINTLVCLIYPGHPASFVQILPNKWYSIVIVYLFSLYIVPYCYNSLLILVETALPLILLVIRFAVNELKIGRLIYLTNDSLRTPQNLQLVYQMSQILMTCINGLFGKLLIPVQTIATLLFIFGSYVAIKHHDKIEIISLLMVLSWSLSAVAGWGGILMLGGYLHSNGQKILTAWKKNPWKYRKERNEMKRFVKSCKPMAICYGKLFVIRRVSLMVFVRGLTRGLKRAILTLEKYNVSR